MSASPESLAYDAALARGESHTVATLRAKLAAADAELERLRERSDAQAALEAKSWRLTIEAVGLRQSDAAAHALTLIGTMMREAHTRGHCCGGTSGNASGRWEAVQ